MTTQRTPDELTTENDLICTKLLGLTKHCDMPSCPDWRTADGKRYWSNPTFDNWTDATLILDALVKRGYTYELHGSDGYVFFGIAEAGSGEFAHESRAEDHQAALAIRAAALEYIRSLP